MKMRNLIVLAITMTFMCLLAVFIIADIDINTNSGVYALMSSHDTYKAEVLVYDEDDTVIYKLYIANDEPILAEVSPNGENLALLKITDTGTKIDIYNLASEDLQSTIDIEMEIYFEMIWLSNTCVSLLSCDKMIGLSEKAEIIDEYEFENKFLCDYYVDECMVLAFADYPNGEANILISINDEFEVVNKEII